MRRNNQDGYFFHRCSLALSKLIAIIILQGGDTEKESCTEGPVVRPERVKHCDIVAGKWQFCLAQAFFHAFILMLFCETHGPDHSHIIPRIHMLHLSMRFFYCEAMHALEIKGPILRPTQSGYKKKLAHLTTIVK